MPHKDPVERAAWLKKYNAKNKEKRAAYQKEYQAANKEKMAAQRKIYQADNREKINEKAREWRKENKEKVADYDYEVAVYRKNWCNKNKEKKAASQKKWRAENKEAITKYNKNYFAENPEVLRNGRHRRRARKEDNGVFVVSNKFMKNLYNSPCVSCGASEAIEADHITPLVKGGRHSEGNLHPLCMPCNRSKGPKLWIEFVAEKKGSEINRMEMA